MELSHKHVAVHHEDAIVVRHARDLFAVQRFGDKVHGALEIYLADWRDTANGNAGRIHPRPRGRLIAARAARKVQRRWFQPERLMRPDLVVLLTELVEGALKVLQ